MQFNASAVPILSSDRCSCRPQPVLVNSHTGLEFQQPQTDKVLAWNLFARNAGASDPYYLYLSVSVCLSVYLSVCLSVCLAGCLREGSGGDGRGWEGMGGEVMGYARLLVSLEEAAEFLRETPEEVKKDRQTDGWTDEQTES